MAPAKETVEVVGEAAASQAPARPKSESGQLRSNAVSLDVPVKVHGSRVVEVVRGTTPHTEPFEEKTSTMIVFPLGGVLKMRIEVSVGQAVVLTNLKTNQDAICRVVKIRTNPNLHSYVEVEFSHPQPGYWGVRFPSDGPVAAKKTASAPPAAPVASTSPAPPRAEAPAQSDKTAPRAEAPRSSIVEPTAASATPEFASFSLEQLRGDSAALSPSSSSTSEHSEKTETRMAESRSDADPAVADGASRAPDDSAFGDLGPTAAARRAFGEALDYSPLGTGNKGQSRENDWTLIGVCAGVLLAIACGGGFYFLHQRARTIASAEFTAPRATPASPTVAQNSAPTFTTPPAVAQPPTNDVAPSAAPAPPAATPVAAGRARETATDKTLKPSAAGPARSPSQSTETSPARQKSATAVPDMFGALNAHPTTAVHDNSSDSGAAPSIDAGSLSSGQGIAIAPSEASPANLAPPPPPPQAAPEGPVRVGGDVKPPQVISAPQLGYPEMARQAGIQGSVVVRIVIDKTGNVTEAHAISGPMLLRDAAVSALRQRKYSPTKLDGRPVSIEMLVTIQFHL